MTTWNTVLPSRNIGFDAAISNDSISRSKLEYISINNSDYQLPTRSDVNNIMYYVTINDEDNDTNEIILPTSVAYTNNSIIIINSSDTKSINIKTPSGNYKIYSKQYQAVNTLSISPRSNKSFTYIVSPSNNEQYEYYEL
mgnify:CR=1 FL=1